MLIRHLESLSNERVTSAETWSSRRLLLKAEGMGFSMHDTIIHARTVTEMHYQNHLEAVYCIEGSGRIEDCVTGEIHEIQPGTLYALDKHDRHVLTADERMRMVCVFNPPIVGPETHDENGVYPLLD